MFLTQGTHQPLRSLDSLSLVRIIIQDHKFALKPRTFGVTLELRQSRYEVHFTFLRLAISCQDIVATQTTPPVEIQDEHQQEAWAYEAVGGGEDGRRSPDERV